MNTWTPHRKRFVLRLATLVAVAMLGLGFAPLGFTWEDAAANVDPLGFTWEDAPEGVVDPDGFTWEETPDGFTWEDAPEDVVDPEGFTWEDQASDGPAAEGFSWEESVEAAR